MSNDASRSVLAGLFEANAQYVHRLADLTQRAIAQGASHSQQINLVALAELDEDIRALTSAVDVPALIPIQLELTRRRWVRRQSALQKLLQSDSANPSAISGELADAFIVWNQQVTRVITEAIGASDVASPWMNSLRQFLYMWPGAYVATELAMAWGRSRV